MSNTTESTTKSSPEATNRAARQKRRIAALAPSNSPLRPTTTNFSLGSATQFGVRKPTLTGDDDVVFEPTLRLTESEVKFIQEVKQNRERDRAWTNNERKIFFYMSQSEINATIDHLEQGDGRLKEIDASHIRTFGYELGIDTEVILYRMISCLQVSTCRLTKLCLNKCNLGDDEANVLCWRLENNNSVQQLQLMFNRMSIGIGAFVSLLEKSGQKSKITQLLLLGNPGYDSDSTIQRKLSVLLTRNRKYRQEHPEDKTDEKENVEREENNDDNDDTQSEKLREKLDKLRVEEREIMAKLDKLEKSNETRKLSVGGLGNSTSLGTKERPASVLFKKNKKK